MNGVWWGQGIVSHHVLMLREEIMWKTSVVGEDAGFDDSTRLYGTTGSNVRM
jgi:hypothetical protein